MSYSNLTSNQIKLPTIIIGTILVLVFSTIYGSWYTVDQSERGVHLRNGAIIGTSEPGLGFKIPFFDSIVKISTQTHTVTYRDIDAYSRDQQPAVLHASVTFSVPPEKVEELYANFKSVESLTARLIDRQVPTQIENIFGKYNAITAVQERVKLVSDINDAIKKSIHGPVTIESVQIESVSFSSNYETNIEARMKAEVEVQTQKQNLDKEIINAKIAVTKAQAEADSQLARAKAQAESIRITGDAEASAIKARAEALAKNQDLIELTKAEKWNGSLPTTMLPNSTLPFFDVKK